MMAIDNNPKRGFRSGRELLACLTTIVTMVLLMQWVLIATDSTVAYTLSWIAMAVLSGLCGCAWQRWGRQRFPLKSQPRYQPTRLFRSPQA